MKYPLEQFNVLVESIDTIWNHVRDFDKYNHSTIHFIVYQQHAKGQEHNRLVKSDEGVIMREGKANELGISFTRLIETAKPFELYPNDTNDNSIETAVRKALKQLNQQNRGL